MSTRTLPLGEELQFHTSTGTIVSRSLGRMVLVEETIFRKLVQSGGTNLDALRALGDGCGSFARTLLPQDLTIEEHAPEAVFSALAAAVAMFGLGRVAVEQWGSALTLKVRDGIALDADGLGNGAFLGGALRTLSGQPVACVPIEPGTFLIVHPDSADAVWAEARRGAGVAAIVNTLH